MYETKTRKPSTRSHETQAPGPGPSRLRGGGYAAQVQMLAPASRGVAGASARLPHLDVIQAAFGRHDVSGVKAQIGGSASDATARLGASAYAYGDRVGFAGEPDLHTAAHEAAHVVQQGGGVQCAGGRGRPGDAYEVHADRVADAVVRGQSAEALLDRYAGGGGGAAVQCDTGGLKGAAADWAADKAKGAKDDAIDEHVDEAVDAVDDKANEALDGAEADLNARLDERVQALATQLTVFGLRPAAQLKVDFGYGSKTEAKQGVEATIGGHLEYRLPWELIAQKTIGLDKLDGTIEFDLAGESHSVLFGILGGLEAGLTVEATTVVHGAETVDAVVGWFKKVSDMVVDDARDQVKGVGKATDGAKPGNGPVPKFDPGELEEESQDARTYGHAGVAGEAALAASISAGIWATSTWHKQSGREYTDRLDGTLRRMGKAGKGLADSLNAGGAPARARIADLVFGGDAADLVVVGADGMVTGSAGLKARGHASASLVGTRVEFACGGEATLGLGSGVDTGGELDAGALARWLGATGLGLTGLSLDLGKHIGDEVERHGGLKKMLSRSSDAVKFVDEHEGELWLTSPKDRAKLVDDLTAGLLLTDKQQFAISRVFAISAGVGDLRRVVNMCDMERLARAVDDPGVARSLAEIGVGASLWFQVWLRKLMFRPDQGLATNEHGVWAYYSGSDEWQANNHKNRAVQDAVDPETIGQGDGYWHALVVGSDVTGPIDGAHLKGRTVVGRYRGLEAAVAAKEAAKDEYGFNSDVRLKK